jgi:hypothetical protein
MQQRRILLHTPEFRTHAKTRDHGGQIAPIRGIVAALFEIVNAACDVAIIAMPDARGPANTWIKRPRTGNPDPTRTGKSLHSNSA